MCHAMQPTPAVTQRHVNIKVEAQDADGNKFQRTFTDWTARIFQHEYDHLQVRRAEARKELIWLRSMKSNF